MIQRIQSVYLAISMILLLIISSGMTVFSFAAESMTNVFSVFGWTAVDGEENVINHEGYPFYIVTGVLVLLIFWCIMSYKKLDLQLKIGRGILVLYLLSIAALLFVMMTGQDRLAESVTRELGIGFLLFVLGFPFIFLANVAIKRDKKLLDSLNRLR